MALTIRMPLHTTAYRAVTDQCSLALLRWGCSKPTRVYADACVHNTVMPYATLHYDSYYDSHYDSYYDSHDTVMPYTTLQSNQRHQYDDYNRSLPVTTL